MVCVGLLYLSFESTLLSPSGEKGPLIRRENGLSRAILGVQIGLIVLATIVTRSSVMSLQAKRGLPKGNQVMGWIILGWCFLLATTILTVRKSHLSRYLSCMSCNQTSTTCTASSSYF